MDILGKLFSSDPLVKIMRLFLMNQDGVFDVQDVSERSLVKESSVKVELKLLESIGFIKSKSFYKEVEEKGKDGDLKIVKRNKKGWYFDVSFHYAEPLHSLLIEYDTLKQNDIAARFKPAGKIKLLIVSGVFLKSEENRLDLMVVGDNLSKRKIDRAIKLYESELGKELKYAIFDTEEFTYRRDMYDKLLCDIFDFPHEVVIHTGSLSTDLLKNR